MQVQPFAYLSIFVGGCQAMKNRIAKNLLKLLVVLLVIIIIGYIFHTFGVVMSDVKAVAR
jgi:flagellar biogenesis protein FliO